MDKFPVFTIQDIKSWAIANSMAKDYVYLMLHNLENRGEIERITKGIYTFHGDISVVGFAFRPFYYGLEYALYVHGFSEQGSNPVVITSRKVRNGIREFKGRNYVVHRIAKKHLFGYELVKVGSLWVPVSDPEKTLIDMIYFRHYLPENLLKALLNATENRKIGAYLEGYEKRFADKVKRIIGKRGQKQA